MTTENIGYQYGGTCKKCNTTTQSEAAMMRARKIFILCPKCKTYIKATTLNGKEYRQ